MKCSLNLVAAFLPLPVVKKPVPLPHTGHEHHTRPIPDVPLISQILVQQGFEVESVTDFGSQRDGVVVGKVLSTKQHPQADKLKVCQVSVGQRTYQVVCGSPNVAEGLVVAYALPGAVLPGKNPGEEMTLTARPLRGVESFGMLCGKDELGFADVTHDIWILNQEFPEFPWDHHLGLPVLETLGWIDVVLEISVTPNRADALCHLGIARELAAGFAFRKLPLALLPSPTFIPNTQAPAKVQELLGGVMPSPWNFTAAGAPAFFLACNYAPEPSPPWLTAMLLPLGEGVGLDVVDVSNLILHAFGQPSHAYDWDRLAEIEGKRQILFRYAAPGEHFEGLDGKSYALTPQDKIASDGEKVTGLLGVLGSEDTKITAQTKRVLLEFAYPDPVEVRQSARRHNKPSQAAFAFEKGIDDSARLSAAAQFLSCLLMEPAAGCGSLKPAEKKPPIPFSTKVVEERLGIPLVSWEEQKKILLSLGFSLEDVPEGALVSVPSWRKKDVSLPEDLVEEIGRIVGLEQIPATPYLPQSPVAALHEEGELFDALHTIRQTASALGFQEVIGLHFAGREDLPRLGLAQDALGTPMELINPLSQASPLLQTTLIPDLLEKCNFNQHRQRMHGQLVQIARTFQNCQQESEALPHDSEYDHKWAIRFLEDTPQAYETLRCAGIVFGKKTEQTWQTPQPGTWAFSDVLSHVLSLFAPLSDHSEEAISWRPLPENHPFAPALHPGQRAAICLGPSALGWVGHFHPQALRNFDIRGECLGFEINVSRWHGLKNKETAPVMLPTPERFPVVERDIAVWVAQQVPVGEMLACLRHGFLKAPVPGIRLKHAWVFDVFADGDSKRKSIGLRLRLATEEETLTQHQIKQAMDVSVGWLQRDFAAELRS